MKCPNCGFGTKTGPCLCVLVSRLVSAPRSVVSCAAPASTRPVAMHQNKPLSEMPDRGCGPIRPSNAFSVLIIVAFCGLWVEGRIRPSVDCACSGSFPVSRERRDIDASRAILSEPTATLSGLVALERWDGVWVAVRQTGAAMRCNAGLEARRGQAKLLLLTAARLQMQTQGDGVKSRCQFEFRM